MKINKILSAGALILTVSHISLGQTPKDISVPLVASIPASRGNITLSWPQATVPAEPIVITKTAITSAGRGRSSTVSLRATDTSYADKSAKLGIAYEVAFSQTCYPNGVAIQRVGCLTFGGEIPLVESRGRVLLLVDSSLAAAIASELDQFAADLSLDGWEVSRADVPRMAVDPNDCSPEGSAARVAELAVTRQAVVNFYNAAPDASRSVILIGHVPVPYSGTVMPDGHYDHQGAWPADIYYGDVNGDWTDTQVQFQQNAPRLHNIPGDGKFDQWVAPSGLELTVGRIDLAGMPTMAQSEVELLRQYLVRNHAYRHGLAPFDNLRASALVDDNFGYFYGEAFASVGWCNGYALFGSGNVFEADWFSTLGSESWLVAYGCGGGWYSGASGVGATSDFASRPSRAVFNLLFGSYFGEWNVSDGLLRAPLGGVAESMGLVSVWANRPGWNFSGMALGQTVGETLKNSTDLSVYRTIMGDPTLRLQHRPAVSGLRTSPANGGLLVEWNPVGSSVIGYHVYQVDPATGTPSRLTGVAVSAKCPHGKPIRETQFFLPTNAPGQPITLQVSAVYLEQSPSGTYYNRSLGAQVSGFAP